MFIINILDYYFYFLYLCEMDLVKEIKYKRLSKEELFFFRNN